MLPLTDSLKWTPTMTWICRLPYQKPSGPCNRFPVPGSNAIPPEVYKHGQVPEDFKDATIVHIYKWKGNGQLCDNHRGISVLNIAGKIFAHLLLNRLNRRLEQGLLPENQYGFRQHCVTTDMIFSTRQLQEKCNEM
ncbi:unnamed protein product [Schistocephalus solidus]|uniref:Reverse transcriptase domain-containing protein n=1 Tax=Schistocephalus solidus TaxID=70667 RepID=A0A183SBU4_SCHSO|nr:unnamed protein product [Schistocephalus solidus]